MPRVMTAFALSLAAAAPGCALSRGGSSVESSVLLGPSGRAEGRIVASGGAEVRVELESEGPGRVDHEVRFDDGTVASRGSLGEAAIRSLDSDPRTLVIVLETYPDAGARVEYVVRSAAAVEVTWDLTRAAGPAAAPRGGP